MAKLKISETQSEQLKRLCAVGPDPLKAALAELSKLQKPLLRPKELRAALRTTLDPEIAQILVQHLIGLLSLQRKYNPTPKEIVSNLTENVDKSDWAEDEKKRWKEIAPVFEKFLSLELVEIVAKALDLSFDYTNLLEKSRILTDIRPVYSEGKIEIIGGIITQTLRLRYQSEDQEQSLSLALDEDDIEWLRDACDQAIKKAEKAKHLFVTQCQLSAFIVGEEATDDS